MIHSKPQPVPQTLSESRDVAKYLIEKLGHISRSSICLAFEPGRMRRQSTIPDPELQLEPLVRHNVKEGYNTFVLITRAEVKYDPLKDEEPIPSVLVIHANIEQGEYHCFATIINDASIGDWKTMKLGDDVRDQMKILPILEAIRDGRTS